ncbi:hypothetical protein, partial [Roseateles sp.]|uniref:hypothetical protein n=1 Tax=Roseateles sp. TaxID=1971397 RepID=UPI00286A3D83
MNGLPSDPFTLLAATILVCGFASVAWLLLAGVARVAPRASVGMALANGLLAAALATQSLRGQAPAWLAFWGSDVLAIATLATLRAVMPALSESPSSLSAGLAWRSALLLLVPAAAALAWLPFEGDIRWHTRIVFGSTLVLTLLATQDAWRQLRTRLSRRSSARLSAPLLVIALFLLLPLLNTFRSPAVAFELLASSEFQLGWLWSMLALGLLINATMALLVLTRVILQIQRLTRR